MSTPVRKIFLIIGLIGLSVAVALSIWILHLRTDLHARIQQKWFTAPIEIFAEKDSSMIAQVHQDSIIWRIPTALDQIPLYCLQAVTAIEDKDFLYHQGVSPTGTLRSLIKNAYHGRWAQGGSTITQQLVKNHFLSAEKSLSRKIKEQILALLLEAEISKDEILEQYLNIVYLGQANQYEVRGIGAAAKFYFGLPTSELNLSQCAMLAGLLQSPGRHSPFRSVENAKKRREQVLNKMLELSWIDETQFNEAKNAALPSMPAQTLSKEAPYFVDAVLKELHEKKIDAEPGLKIWTSMDQNMQALAQRQLTQGLRDNKSSVPLQGAALIVDIENHQVSALVGGESFAKAPFNRALLGQRQIGSLAKPFVYLSAFINSKKFNAMSTLEDSPLEWKVDKNIWRPQNYTKKYLGPVPAFLALSLSLNLPAVRLGQEVGVQNYLNVLKDAGWKNDLAPLPSYLLGSFEMSPWDVAQIYSTLAGSGDYMKLSSILRIENLKNEIVYQREDSEKNVFDPKLVAPIWGMMSATPEVGTARRLQEGNTVLVDKPLAVKTGTTNDGKDSWIVGFTPKWLIVVWVGNDQSASASLTGAGAALTMLKSMILNSGEIFWTDSNGGAISSWPLPEDMEEKSMSLEAWLDKYPGLLDRAFKDNEKLKDKKIKLIFAE